jgi:hypothetical protein
MSDTRRVVIADIPFNGGTVYAYRVGDKVDESAVKANGWEDYVASPSTKAAKEALGATDTPQGKDK